MHVKDVMTTSPEIVNANTTLKDVAARMKALNVGAMPVNSEDRLAGIITDRDITIRAVAEGLDPKVTTVEQAMTGEIAYCYEDQDLTEAANIMKEKQIRRLAVLNKDKRLVGICSLGDIVASGQEIHMGGETLHEISKPAKPKR